jgi:hypothetical protein
MSNGAISFLGTPSICTEILGFAIIQQVLSPSSYENSNEKPREIQ